MKTGCCGIAGVCGTLKTKAMRSVFRAIVAVAAVLSADFANAAAFNMLSCCPGEDCARQARFVWHSDSGDCTLWYAKASAPGSAVEAPCTSVKKPVAFRSSDVSYYKCTAEISGLEPGTEYIYFVKSGSSQSPVQKFKTAGTSGSYNFLWLSDVHSHPDNPGKMDTVELLRKDAEARTASSGGIDFVLFSGDAVKYGSRYDNWQQWNGSPSVTNYTFAMIPGNKEYYYTGSSTFYDYYWYLAVKNNPPNGPGTAEQEGCYWFLRDSVMFVGIDSLIHKGSRMTRYGDKTSVLRDQTNWFDRVVTSQRGKFRYLVVVQHDPWFVYAASKDSFDKSRGNYDTWRHVFDKHKVDLALSGDEHNYIRSKPLRGDSANSDGTVYMVAGQIEESNYSATITTAISSYGNANAAKYFACMGASDASCGAAWIEVRPDSLKVTEFWDKYQSPNYKQYDSFEITPKDRGFVYDPSGGTTGGDATPHKRYRFKVDAPRSDTFCMQLSEIQLLDANGTAIPSSSFTIAYDSTTKDSYGDIFPDGEAPECAVDGDTSTKWLDWRAGLAQSSVVRSAAWLDFCFAQPVEVHGYRWYTANDAPGRTPVSWTFSASDDDGATWTVLDKVVGYDTTTDFKALAYSKSLDGLPATPAATADGTYYALAVGVDLYKNPDNNLSCCNIDVNDVLGACTNSVNGLWRPANCYRVCDSNATLSAVRAQFQSLAAMAKSGDTVLYYQSSHGGEDVLCLHDKDYSESNFASDLMRFASGVRVIVMLDACHSASMFKDAGAAPQAQGAWNFAANVETRMAELREELRAKGAKSVNLPSVGWMTACDYDQYSWGGSSGSTFTTKMVDAWKSAESTDSDGDGYNDFLEIFNAGAPQATGDHGDDGWTIPQKLNDDMLASVAAWNIAGTPAPRVHGKWIGGNGDDRFSVAANWDNGVVPGAGDALDFSSVTSATTIEADVNAAFGAITMGSGVVTFTGSLTAGSYSDLSKVAVGANATVTLVGDLVFANKTDKATDYIAYAIAAGGAFVVTGDIVSSQAGKGYLVPTVNGGDGMIVSKGLVQNSSCSDNPSFRLVRDAAGTVRWVIGADGISGTKNYWLLNNGGKPTAIIKPDNSDFAISAKIGNRQVATLRFDTTGRDGTGHTITITGSIYREGKVNVEGAGTVVCSYVQSDSSNPFIVSDTATLALNAGSNIGTGGVTVNSGAALALSGAGTAKTGGAIALKSGSRLVFGQAGAQGYSSLSAKSMSIDGNAVFEIPSQTLGEFTVLTLTDGSLDASAVSKLALSVASPDPALVSTLVVADGGKSVKVSTVHAWPEDWNGGRAANAAMQTEFAKWIAVPGNDPSSARAEAAFLLGLDLADYKEDLKVVSVAMQDGRFAIDVNVDLAKVRGRLYVLVADSPVDMEKSGSKITVSAEDISEVAGIDASGSAKFFKVGVDYGAATP